MPRPSANWLNSLKSGSKASCDTMMPASFSLAPVVGDSGVLGVGQNSGVDLLSADNKSILEEGSSDWHGIPEDRCVPCVRRWRLCMLLLGCDEPREWPDPDEGCAVCTDSSGADDSRSRNCSPVCAGIWDCCTICCCHRCTAVASVGDWPGVGNCCCCMDVHDGRTWWTCELHVGVGGCCT